ncbi:MAG: prephenate dehydratase [Chloroflexi bacterium]|nr:prephenate dehydratase [Chloroflexota bacterium]
MSEQRIAYLGPAGTFSEEAALRYAASSGRLVPFPSFPALIEAVETGLTDVAILPIENSLEGSVTVALDLLIHETDLRMCGELVLPVRHFLIARPGADITDITHLISHPQPLGQCRRFLDRCLSRVAVTAALSTATAVVDALAAEGQHTAAISTRRAAELYGGALLAHDIQDNDNNVTRFVVLAHHDAPPTGHDRTSLCFTLHGARQPGTLYAALACFAEAGINLSKLESRPTKEELGVYIFVIDLDGHQADPVVAAALDRLRAVAETVKIFGSYPRSNGTAGS